MCELGTIDNCGTCGNHCKGMDADWACIGGTCTILTCKSADRGDCNRDPSDGCETKLNMDGDNCGICGNRCLLGLGCKNGVCLLGL